MVTPVISTSHASISYQIAANVWISCTQARAKKLCEPYLKRIGIQLLPLLQSQCVLQVTDVAVKTLPQRCFWAYAPAVCFVLVS
nr:MAG TPA: hypothetical protein [Caudoviricetes sp.]